MKFTPFVHDDKFGMENIFRGLKSLSKDNPNGLILGIFKNQIVLTHPKLLKDGELRTGYFLTFNSYDHVVYAMQGYTLAMSTIALKFLEPVDMCPPNVTI